MAFSSYHGKRVCYLQPPAIIIVISRSINIACIMAVVFSVSATFWITIHKYWILVFLSCTILKWILLRCNNWKMLKPYKRYCKLCQCISGWVLYVFVCDCISIFAGTLIDVFIYISRILTCKIWCYDINFMPFMFY